MIEINRNPSRRELFWFGILLAVFVALAGLILRLRFDLPRAGEFVWGVGAGLLFVYLIAPPSRKLIYLAWMYAVFPIGWAVSHLLLALIYYLVLTPIGLLMRVLGHDAMKQKFDRQAPTYWEQHRPAERERYFRQF